MAKIDGDEEELTGADAAIVKGMLVRGDKQHHIAAYFGVDSRAISHVKTSKTFAGVAPLPVEVLPPPGPYRVDQSFERFYKEMAKVNQLWEGRDLKAAKALLESRLKNPLLSIEEGMVEEALNDLFRDNFGILKF
jgi:hypothetical protein